MVFTWRTCSSHGCFLGSGGVSRGRTRLMEDSSSSESFQTISLLSFPCLYQRISHTEGNQPRGDIISRDQPSIAPAPCSQKGPFVSSPHGDGPLDGNAPDYDPAICISGNEPAVGAHELDHMDLGRMAAEDVGRLCRGQRHCDTTKVSIVPLGSLKDDSPRGFVIAADRWVSQGWVSARKSQPLDDFARIIPILTRRASHAVFFKLDQCRYG